MDVPFLFGGKARVLTRPAAQDAREMDSRRLPHGRIRPVSGRGDEPDRVVMARLAGVRDAGLRVGTRRRSSVPR
jgi:hypothetical protein